MTINKPISSNREGKYYDRKILSSERPFQLILKDLISDINVSSSELGKDILDAIPKLVKGYKYFKERASNVNVNTITTIKIGEISLEVSENERRLVSEVSEFINLDFTSALELFKIFVVSNDFKPLWKDYLYGIDLQEFSQKTQLNRDMNKEIGESFITFYCNERISIFNILSELLRLANDKDKPSHIQASNIFTDILEKNPNFVIEILEQLNSVANHFNAESPELSIKITYQEFRSLLEFLFLLIELKPILITNEVTLEYIKWYFTYSSKSLMRDYSYFKISHEYISSLSTIEFALFIKVLRFDKLDFGIGQFAKDSIPHKKDVELASKIIKLVWVNQSDNQNGPIFLALAIYTFALYNVYLKYFKDDSEIGKEFIDLFTNPSKFFPLEFSNLTDNSTDKMFYLWALYQADNFSYWEKLNFYLNSSVLNHGNPDSLYYKSTFKYFLMSFAASFPNIVSYFSFNYIGAIRRLFLNEPTFCDYFWEVDFNVGWKRFFLDIFQHSFPFKSEPLSSLLCILSGPSKYSSSQVIKYFKNLPSLTVELTDLNHNDVVVAEGELNKQLIKIKQDSELISIRGSAKLIIPEGSFGIISTRNSTDLSLATLKTTLNGWYYILAKIDDWNEFRFAQLMSDKDDIDHLIPLIELISKTISLNPSSVEKLFDFQGTQVESLQILIERCKSIFDLCFQSSRLNSKLLAPLLRLFSVLAPAYPSHFKTLFDSKRMHYISSEFAMEYVPPIGPSIISNLINVEQKEGTYEATISFLDYSIALATIYTQSIICDKKTNDSPICSYSHISVFVKASYDVVFSYIFPSYVNWYYTNTHQIFLIGQKVFKLFRIILELGPSFHNPRINDVTSVLVNQFYSDEGSIHNICSILSYICNSKKHYHRLLNIGDLQSANLSRLFLKENIMFLVQFIKNTLTNKDIQTLQIETLLRAIFSTSDSNFSNVISHSFDLISVIEDPEISLAATDLISLMLYLAFKKNKAPLSLLADINLDQVKISVNFYKILTDNCTSIKLKNSLLCLCANISSSLPSFFHVIMTGDLNLANMNRDDELKPSLIRYVKEEFERYPLLKVENSNHIGIIIRFLRIIWTTNPNHLTDINFMIVKTGLWTYLLNCIDFKEYDPKLFSSTSLITNIYKIAYTQLNLLSESLNGIKCPMINSDYSKLIHELISPKFLSNWIEEILFVPSSQQVQTELKSFMKIYDIREDFLDHFLTFIWDKDLDPITAYSDYQVFDTRRYKNFYDFKSKNVEEDNSGYEYISSQITDFNDNQSIKISISEIFINFSLVLEAYIKSNISVFSSSDAELSSFIKIFNEFLVSSDLKVRQNMTINSKGLQTLIGVLYNLIGAFEKIKEHLEDEPLSEFLSNSMFFIYNCFDLADNCLNKDKEDYELFKLNRIGLYKAITKVLSSFGMKDIDRVYNSKNDSLMNVSIDLFKKICSDLSKFMDREAHNLNSTSLLNTLKALINGLSFLLTLCPFDSLNKINGNCIVTLLNNLYKLLNNYYLNNQLSDQLCINRIIYILTHFTTYPIQDDLFIKYDTFNLLLRTTNDINFDNFSENKNDKQLIAMKNLNALSIIQWLINRSLKNNCNASVSQLFEYMNKSGLTLNKFLAYKGYSFSNYTPDEFFALYWIAKATITVFKDSELGRTNPIISQYYLELPNVIIKLVFWITDDKTTPTQDISNECIKTFGNPMKFYPFNSSMICKWILYDLIDYRLNGAKHTWMSLNQGFFSPLIRSPFNVERNISFGTLLDILNFISPDISYESTDHLKKDYYSMKLYSSHSLDIGYHVDDKINSFLLSLDLYLNCMLLICEELDYFIEDSSFSSYNRFELSKDVMKEVRLTFPEVDNASKSLTNFPANHNELDGFYMKFKNVERFLQHLKLKTEDYFGFDFE